MVRFSIANNWCASTRMILLSKLLGNIQLYCAHATFMMTLVLQYMWNIIRLVWTMRLWVSWIEWTRFLGISEMQHSLNNLNYLRNKKNLCKGMMSAYAATLVLEELKSGNFSHTISVYTAPIYTTATDQVCICWIKKQQSVDTTCFVPYAVDRNNSITVD